jgi:hypothetical protein
VEPASLISRSDLLQLGGRWLQEVYFAFQFDERGVREDVGGVVRSLREASDDKTIADWLVRPNAELGAASPLAWVTGRRGATLVEVFSRRS